MHPWKLDTAHTAVGFTAKHMMVSRVRGLFSGITGSLDFDEANPTASTVQVVIPAASIETGMAPRDAHLRSADFLDAEQFPTLTFASTAVKPQGDHWVITGDLTMHGITRPVALEAETLGVVTGSDGRRHAGFEAHAKIKRSDWGLTWNKSLEAGGWLVSDDITIDLDVAADELAAVTA